MRLPSSIPKASLQPIWFIVTQADSETQQRIKLDQKENTGTSISKTTRPHTSKSFSMVLTDVLIVTKKALTRKHKLDASKVVFSCAL